MVTTEIDTTQSSTQLSLRTRGSDSEGGPTELGVGMGFTGAPPAFSDTSKKKAKGSWTSAHVLPNFFSFASEDRRSARKATTLGSARPTALSSPSASLFASAGESRPQPWNRGAAPCSSSTAAEMLSQRQSSEMSRRRVCKVNSGTESASSAEILLQRQPRPRGFGRSAEAVEPTAGFGFSPPEKPQRLDEGDTPKKAKPPATSLFEIFELFTQVQS